MAIDSELHLAIDKAAKELEVNGYAAIPKFLSKSEIEGLKTACMQLMDENLDTKDAHLFSTGNNQNDIHGDDYFLTSNDKIRFFFEVDAVKSVDDREVIVHDTKQAVNKIGHALHWLDPTFKAVSHSEKIKALCSTINLQDPRIVQSMYIFKQPFIGGAVTIHKDSTFLNTQPTSRLLGLWFALEDATIDNGCLWFAKGTHREEPTQRMVRNQPGKTPQTVFRGTNREYKDEEFTPAPVKAGTCVLIHANVAHKSRQNTSPQSRHAYTFHIVDFGNGTKYSEENWLEQSKIVPFRNIFDVEVPPV